MACVALIIGVTVIVNNSISLFSYYLFYETSGYLVQAAKEIFPGVL